MPQTFGIGLHHSFSCLLLRYLSPSPPSPYSGSLPTRPSPVGKIFPWTSKNTGSPDTQYATAACPECDIMRITLISSLFGIISESRLSSDRDGNAFPTSARSFLLQTENMTAQLEKVWDSPSNVLPKWINTSWGIICFTNSCFASVLFTKVALIRTANCIYLLFPGSIFFYCM